MKRIFVIATVFLLNACGEADSDDGSYLSNGPVIKRVVDHTQLARGEKIFKQNCATCHGEAAEGDAEWRKIGADGKYPPPPLNGTGHAWHHSNQVLRQVIMHGSPGGQGNMPAWKDRLTEEEINDVIAWFQSRWPDEVYGAWYERFKGE